MVFGGDSQAFGQLRRAAGIGFWQNNHKFFAAHPRHKIGITDTGEQYVGKIAQQQIARQMPKGIVVAFEMIQIQRQQRQRIAIAQRSGDFAFQHRRKMALIIQAG